MNGSDNTLSLQADDARARVGDAIRSGQEAAHQAVDRLADGAGRLAGNAESLAHRGAEALRESSAQLRERAREAATSTIVHIRHDPVKAVLLAGVIGVALGVLLGRRH